MSSKHYYSANDRLSKLIFFTYYNSLPNEIWKEIDGDERYFISSYGRVLSLCHSKPILLKPWDNNKGQGYLYVDLGVKHFPQKSSIHSLVAKAFIPKEKESQTQIHHKNGKKHDNRLDNLQRVEPKEHTRLDKERRQKEKKEAAADEKTKNRSKGETVQTFPNQ